MSARSHSQVLAYAGVCGTSLGALTPERIRRLSVEEVAEKCHAAEEERRTRYRAVYEDLRLSLTAHGDGTLELRWAGGESALEPQVLQERSVLKRT